MSQDRDADARFEARLRADLHAAAGLVQSDQEGWRQLDGRIARRRTAARGGLAMAGVAIAVTVVSVVPLGRQQVLLAPGVASSDGVLPTVSTAPTPGPTVSAAAVPSPPAGGAAAAGGVVYSDGDSIHVADVQGTVLWTPAQGEGTSTITDLAVLPGGTLDDFTMTYRFDVTVDDAACGDISWTRVVGAGNNPAGGGLPGASTADSGDCLGAPVFASDGSALAWLAEGADGGWLLQTLDWSPEGPVGALVSFPLDLEGLGDPAAVAWEVAHDGGDTAGSGTLSFRATDVEGTRLFTIPTVRTVGGALTLPPVAPDPTVLPVPQGLAGLLDVDGPWRVGTTDATGGPQGPVVGVALTAAAEGGRPDVSGPVTDLGYDAGGPLFADAIDGAALLLGAGSNMQLLTTGSDPAQSLVSATLPTATTGALLAPGGG